MSTSAAIIHASQGSMLSADQADRIRGRVQDSRAAKTWAAYAGDWADFSAWTAGQGLAALPAAPETVAAYVDSLAELGRKPSTLQRRLAAISVRHQGAGFDSPCGHALVRSTMAGIRRQVGTAQERKRPLRLRDIRAAFEAIESETLTGQRDRALILLGYAGGFRRSELAGLAVADIEERPEGLAVTVRRSKTDQEGAGQVKGIPFGSNPQTCPVRALRSWLAAAGISSGAIFRGIGKDGRTVAAEALCTRTVARIVKKAAKAAGLPESELSGHSLRAGFVTDGYAAGAAEAAIMQQTGHRSREVLAVYRREADLFQSAAVRLGL